MTAGVSLLNSFVSSSGARNLLAGQSTSIRMLARSKMVLDGSTLTDFVGSTSFALSDGIANAWSVNGDTLNSADIASTLFAGSLFPYLAFLWLLARPETKTPIGANWGFQFLLVFVFATIPAGILAKVQYNDILANVDFLHGIAESMLTLTNLFIIYGFRATRPQPASNNSSLIPSLDINLLALVVGGGLFAAQVFANAHPEPTNALSIPTWMVHTSSLLEWLYAMKLVWEHAETSGNPRWKGLTWAMIPSHTSGVCACTFHLFYNSPLLLWIVNLQALLTCVGNTALAFATYRVYSYAKNQEIEQDVAQLPPAQPLGDTDFEFNRDMLAKTTLAALTVKYGELYLNAPFEAHSQDAVLPILAFTLLNVGKWSSRSKGPESDSESAKLSDVANT